MQARPFFRIAVGTAMLLMAAHWVYECVLIIPLVSDAQSGAAILLATIGDVVVFALACAAIWFAATGLLTRSPAVRLISALPLLLVLGWFTIDIVALTRYRGALLDSADPTTGADRLRELVNFSSGPGYEIDNRLARHPNTPPDVLRLLYARPDQIGTRICLAQNPNTPDDLLVELSKADGERAELVVDALKRNPRFAEVLGPRE